MESEDFGQVSSGILNLVSQPEQPQQPQPQPEQPQQPQPQPERPQPPQPEQPQPQQPQPQPQQPQPEQPQRPQRPQQPKQSEAHHWDIISSKGLVDLKLAPGFPPDFNISFTNVLPKESVLKEISMFFHDNNCTSKGNTVYLPPEAIKRFFSITCYLGILRNSFGVVIGTIFSSVFPAKIGGQNINSSYTTHLCVDINYRNKTLCPALITGIIKVGYAKGYKHGYYLTEKKFHNASSEIQSWWRVLNLEAAKKAGFAVSGDYNSTKDRLSYRTAKPKHAIVKVNDDSFWPYYETLTSGKFFILRKMKNLHLMLDVYRSESGLFGIFPLLIRIGTTGKTVSVALLAFCVGDIDKLLVEACYMAQETGFSVLHGYLAGDITEAHITTVKGTLSSVLNLGTYNQGTSIDPKTFYMPMV